MCKCEFDCVFKILGIHEFLESITKAFVNLTESTIETVSKAQALYLHLSNVNLVEEINLVEKTLKKAKNLSQAVGNISDEVMTNYKMICSIKLLFINLSDYSLLFSVCF